MKKNIELFCGINEKMDVYSDNKTLVWLYAVFMFFFVIVVAFLDYYKTKNIFSLIVSLPFLFLSVLFFVWLYKSKKKKSSIHYFLFQGCVALSISLIWLFVAFINISSNKLGFSIFYIYGAIFGVIFVVIFFFLRFLKWKSYKLGNIKEDKQLFNNKIVCISILLLMFFLKFLKFKEMEKIILYKILTGGLIVLFFIFLTIAINMFVNYYIVKKYYL